MVTDSWLIHVPPLVRTLGGADMAEADRQLFVCVMVETVEALESIEDILAVPGSETSGNTHTRARTHTHARTIYYRITAAFDLCTSVSGSQSVHPLGQCDPLPCRVMTAAAPALQARLGLHRRERPYVEPRPAIPRCPDRHCHHSNRTQGCIAECAACCYD